MSVRTDGRCLTVHGSPQGCGGRATMSAIRACSARWPPKAVEAGRQPRCSTQRLEAQSAASIRREMYVHGTWYVGPAQRERALALSRKRVRQSRAPAARRRIHGGALLNIDVRKWGQRPHLRASHIIKVVLVRPYVYDCKGEQPRKFRLQASFVTVEMQAAGLPQADRPARWSAVPLSPRSG